MAARYWVGGTGNWSDAANHWSAVSGGTPNAANLPTSADDVYFDESSHTTNFTVTFTTNGICKDFDFRGLTTKLCTLVNEAYNKTLSIYGSLFSNNVIMNWQGSSKVEFRSTGSETLSGTSLFCFNFTFNGVGGKWTFLNNMNFLNTINLANGELDINGQHIVTSNFSVNAGTKTLTLGTGTLEVYSWGITYPVGFTFNCNTGTILFKPGSNAISGVTTFYNLKIQSTPTVTRRELSVMNNITILNLLTIDGVSNDKRILFRGAVYGTQVTVTAENTAIQFVDFMDIKGAGNGNWDLSGCVGGTGDGQNNSGIIFTPPKTCYYYGLGGNWSDLTKWFSETNGGGLPNYFPICHDDVIFDENSLLGNSVINYNCSQTGKNIYFTDIASNLEIYFGTSNWYRFLIFGSLYLSNKVSLTGNIPSMLFFGRSIYYLKSGTVDCNGIEIVNCNGMLTFLSDVICKGLQTSPNAFGGFDMNDFDLTAASIILYGKECYFRSGVITLTTNSYTAFNWVSGMIFAGTSIIVVSPTAGLNVVTFQVYGTWDRALNDIRFEGTHTGGFELIIQGYPINTQRIKFNSLFVKEGKRLKVTGGATVTLNTLECAGTPGNVIELTSTNTTPFNMQNLSLNDISVEYCNISYSTVTGSPRIKNVMDKAWVSIKRSSGVAKALIKKVFGVNVNSGWIARNSTDLGNNSGWEFE